MILIAFLIREHLPTALLIFSPFQCRKSILLLQIGKHVFAKVILFLDLMSRSLSSSISISQENMVLLNIPYFLYISWYMYCTSHKCPFKFYFPIFVNRKTIYPESQNKYSWDYMICLLYIFQIVNVFKKPKAKVKTNRTCLCIAFYFSTFSKFFNIFPASPWNSGPVHHHPKSE